MARTSWQPQILPNPPPQGKKNLIRAFHAHSSSDTNTVYILVCMFLVALLHQKVIIPFYYFYCFKVP